MNIVFMRHGEATDNVRKVFSDREIYWSVLTENGVETVQETIKNLPSKIDKIYVSPLPRTVQTAHLVYQSHLDADVVIDNRIREIYHGKYSGQKNNKELDETREKQIAGDYFVRLGDYGENKLEIELRLSSFLKDVCEKNSKNATILVVSHGSITSYMKRILKLSSPHLTTGKSEEFDNVDFTNLYDYSKRLDAIKREKEDC